MCNVRKTNLQLMRKRAGFKSAREFAERVGLSVNTYTNYEQGKANMTLLQAWEFADLLDCTIDELAGRSVPEKAQLDEHDQRLIDVYHGATQHEQVMIDAMIDAAARLMDEQAKNKAQSA